ncbi:hypothetical protein KC19_12G057600 [Ceratodon purpureus]|uniref:Uncharacterized protein n=1 Tax=Ceratodon purpureus TaxID=3225 RepID=A0A8T0G412_CERPU|nr:hypothetical protein KC19_12G057600 [Ceratodon purpureus]
MLAPHQGNLQDTYRVHLRYDVLSCDTYTQSLVRAQVPPTPTPTKPTQHSNPVKDCPKNSKRFAIQTLATHNTSQHWCTNGQPHTHNTTTPHLTNETTYIQRRKKIRNYPNRPGLMS